MRGHNRAMATTASHAFILFAHGARDMKWAQTLHLLRDAVRARRPDSHVGLAFLEFQTPTLGDALETALAAGCRRIDIAPVFWSSGGHVANDLPPLLDTFRRAHPQVELALLPVLSELPGMMDFIASAVDRLAAPAR
jgi:sirohydrochlorin cobaltochelatase